MLYYIQNCFSLQSTVPLHDTVRINLQYQRVLGCTKSLFFYLKVRLRLLAQQRHAESTAHWQRVCRRQ